MAFTFARCCHPAIRRAGGKKKRKKKNGPIQGCKVGHISLARRHCYFSTVANFQAGAFFFSLKCTSVEEGGEGGWSEDETIDLIMHACFLIHCSGGKGKGRG